MCPAHLLWALRYSSRPSWDEGTIVTPLERWGPESEEVAGSDLTVRLATHPTETHIPRTPAGPRDSTDPSVSLTRVVCMVSLAQLRMPPWKDRAVGGWVHVGSRGCDPLNTLATIPQRLGRPGGGAALSLHPPGAEQRAT